MTTKFARHMHLPLLLKKRRTLSMDVRPMLGGVANLKTSAIRATAVWALLTTVFTSLTHDHARAAQDSDINRIVAGVKAYGSRFATIELRAASEVFTSPSAEAYIGAEVRMLRMTMHWKQRAADRAIYKDCLCESRGAPPGRYASRFDGTHSFALRYATKDKLLMVSVRRGNIKQPAEFVPSTAAGLFIPECAASLWELCDRGGASYLGTEEVLGVLCEVISVETAGPEPGSSLRLKCYLDPARDFIPVRMKLFRITDGNETVMWIATTSEFMETVDELTATTVPFPYRTTQETFLHGFTEQPVPLQTVSWTTSEVHVNPKLGNEAFQIDLQRLPAGTMVDDGVNKNRYVVGNRNDIYEANQKRYRERAQMHQRLASDNTSIPDNATPSVPVKAEPPTSRISYVAVAGLGISAVLIIVGVTLKYRHS